MQLDEVSHLAPAHLLPLSPVESPRGLAPQTSISRGTEEEVTGI